MKSLFISLIFFTLAFNGCIPATKEKKEFPEPAEYNLLGKDSLNKLLCFFLRHISEHSAELRPLVAAGANADCSCHYTEHGTNDWISRTFFRASPTWTRDTDLKPGEMLFETDSLELLKYFVNHGASMDGIVICRSGNVEMWRYLLSKGFKMDDFIYLRTDVEQDTAALNFLFKNGLDVNNIFPQNSTTIVNDLACAEHSDHDDTAIYHFLWRKGASFTYHGSPLYCAIKYKKPLSFSFFMQHGAAEMIRKKQAFYLNHVISGSRKDEKLEMATAIMEAGEDVNRDQGTFDPSLVYQAIKGDNPKILELLFDHGANFRQRKDAYGFKKECTPYDFAADECASKCLEVLLKRFPGKFNSEKLIGRIERDMRDHPEFAGKDPKCKECIELLKAADH